MGYSYGSAPSYCDPRIHGLIWIKCARAAPCEKRRMETVAAPERTESFDVMALARIIAAQFATIIGPVDDGLSKVAEG